MRVIDKRQEFKGRYGDDSALWISETVTELKQERDYLIKYGLRGYFRDSIRGLLEPEGSPAEELCARQHQLERQLGSRRASRSILA
jgi:hypothetical protein